MTGKYTPLENYLKELTGHQKEVTLSFEQVERILNDRLPPSAHQYIEWWSYERHPRSPEKRAIANAGWKVVDVNLPGKWVRLMRNKEE